MPREAELVLGSTPISSSHDASSSNPPISASTCVSDFVRFNAACVNVLVTNSHNANPPKMSKLMQLKITRYLEKQDGEMCNDNSNVRPRLYQCHDYDNSNRLSCDPTSTCSGEKLSGFSSRDSEVIMSFHGVGCSKHDEVAQCCKWSRVFFMELQRWVWAGYQQPQAHLPGLKLQC